MGGAATKVEVPLAVGRLEKLVLRRGDAVRLDAGDALLLPKRASSNLATEERARGSRPSGWK